MNEKVKRLLKNENDNFIFPFLWLHGESEETLREYMNVIYESNIRAVCVESRPHPDFCGEKWWRDMDIILDEARRRKMQVWILDDSHFPTGYANGAMAGKPDELCRQSICCRTYEPKGQTLFIGKEEIMHPNPFIMTMIEEHIMEKDVRVFEDDRLLALTAMDQSNGKIRDLRPFLKDNELNWKVPEGNWKVYAIHLSRNHGYRRSNINMMNKESCRILLDAVYEPHYQHYKEDFGTTIAGFFSDEPELGNGHMYEMDDAFGTSNDYPWSEELEKKLKYSLGTNYGQLMAFLWDTKEDSEMAAKVRYAYMDAVTRLVEEDFSKQIGNWCREHGVNYIGHLIEDDNHHTRTGASLGHYFRGLAGQDMSGIDNIGGQVIPQGEEISYNNGVFQHRIGEFYHYILGKLGSSQAAIEPIKNGNSMCEIFGNYGWEEGVRLEKYLADHFLVRGINHYVPHAFSPKDFPDHDCPPHFYAHGHNPQYRHFGCLMAYMNRVCELISGGVHAAPAAVLYHAEGEWTGKHMTMDAIGHRLADAQIEYDIIPQDVFTERTAFCTQICNGKLKVNTQEYRIVIIPYMQYITKALAEAVTELKRNHVPVIFVNGYPQGYCDMEQITKEEQDWIFEIRNSVKKAEPDKLVEELKKKDVQEIILNPSDSRIRYCRYIHKDGTQVYLLVNEGTQIYKGRIQFTPRVESTLCLKKPYQYDAWDNKIYQVQRNEDSIYLEIEPLKSKIIVFDADNVQEELPQMLSLDEQEKERVELSEKWKRSICESIRYPVFEKEKEVILPDHLAKEEPEFSGFVRYENRLEYLGTGRYLLEITDASEGVEVFVNEKSLGIQIVPVFRYDLTPSLIPGDNTIRIEVATTLERQLADVPDILGNKKEAKSLSGITGEVRIWNIR